MNSSQRYLITKMAGLGEYADPVKFVKGKHAGKDLVKDFVAGATRNPRLAFIENGNDGTIYKMASVEGVTGAIKNFLGNPHGQELAALGLLCLPAAHHMISGRDKTDKAMGAAELAGLGGLSIPSIQHFRGK